MASEQDCERALRGLAEKLSAVDPDLRGKHIVARTLSCTVPDLDVVFLASLEETGLEDLRVADADDPSAQVRLTASSDDLVALVEGELSAPAAWATGRLRVSASPLDLLKLRALL